VIDALVLREVRGEVRVVAASQLEARDLADIQLGTLTRYFEPLGYDDLTLTPKP
jgi:hypothetical protein